MSRSLTCGGEEKVPGIPGACATCNFTYLARGTQPEPVMTQFDDVGMCCQPQRCSPAHTDLFGEFGHVALEHGMQDLDDEEEAETEDDQCDDQQDGACSCIRQVTLSEKILACNINMMRSLHGNAFCITDLWWESNCNWWIPLAKDQYCEASMIFLVSFV